MLTFLFGCLTGPRIIQGYSKRSVNFQKCILQVLLNMWRRAIF
jgi:hypothetical protein